MHGSETIRKMNDEQYLAHTAKKLEEAKRSNIPSVVAHFEKAYEGAVSRAGAKQ